jgi:hypothetical protein
MQWQKYKNHPSSLAKHGWLLFLLTLLITFLLLPTAHHLHQGGSPLIGYLLHRSFILLFALSSACGLLSFCLELYRQLVDEHPFIKRLGTLIKAGNNYTLLSSIGEHM